MSGTPVSFDQHPPHGHPSNTGPSTQNSDKPSTASHAPDTKPDPTDTAPHPILHGPDGKTGGPLNDAAQGGQSTASSASATKLAHLKSKVKSGLRQFPDFPSKGVLFEDIMPIFASHALHTTLIEALELQIAEAFQTQAGEKSEIDVIVGLESRGFLFGPALALRLGAGFVPVRKQGKLPGPCETVTYKKEYGEDVFQMQSDAFKSGQKVVIVDDIIATGGTAAAAGQLVRKLGGTLLGFVFMMELDFLKGREKLDAPAYTLLSGQEESSGEGKGETIDDKLPLGRTKESAEEANKSVTDTGGSLAEARP
ncbi:adenine phosphoribosyltransferase [Friedmanniomyces endolithicus]|uniref:adenine phosphoribosyltransferase n=1 Tax=Friedmanniomyces endolithicus TaxID=329885 RepID=A0AAN6KJA6_9PEZI|nr:adenine phosphoribosyltransferase [Friedmanniomyces endolithicus]KAK0774547.1 adenine phosphoribosyltransferase [Friedmanniomyces endolithicus]KAK0791009.1 adenine phosphoribosyltransferase [Friedmanniomyces endolithicus]KAK0796177.1 adenine phosphoribosyltransferase [Friedmanniomyces endolithicus]KAK0837848.1 adenine phosphoribosyltransferase [Friedmanniomyces endolithicus]